jgi:hypothetical protein
MVDEAIVRRARQILKMAEESFPGVNESDR